MEDLNETLSSIAAAAADIQRWTLLMAFSGRVSRDRTIDIQHAAERIATLNAKLAHIKE